MNVMLQQGVTYIHFPPPIRPIESSRVPHLYALPSGPRCSDSAGCLGGLCWLAGYACAHSHGVNACLWLEIPQSPVEGSTSACGNEVKIQQALLWQVIETPAAIERSPFTMSHKPIDLWWITNSPLLHLNTTHMYQPHPFDCQWDWHF